MSLGQNYDFEIKVNDPNYVAVTSKFNTKVSFVDRNLAFQVYKKTDKQVETEDLKVKIEYENSSAYSISDWRVQLFANGQAEKDGGGWPTSGTRLEVFVTNEVTFHNLPKYDQAGKLINYSVKAFQGKNNWEENFTMRIGN